MSTNKKSSEKRGALSRRKFFGLSAVVGTSLAAGTLGGANTATAETAGPSGPARPPDMRDDPSILQLQSQMASGRLTSPAIAITAANRQLRFRNFFNTESGFDGGALEISIAGGAFQERGLFGIVAVCILGYAAYKILFEGD